MKKNRIERIVNDPLTNVPNKKTVETRLATDLETNQESPYSVILFDIDFFKYVNEQFGHPQGDEVLREIGSILNSLEQSMTRYKGLCGKYGGEEFLITAPTATEENAISLAEEIRTTVEKHRFKDVETSCSLEEEISISLGINMQDLAELSNIPTKKKIETVINRADIALSYSKLMGRNRTSVFNQQIKQEIEYRNVTRQFYYDLGKANIDPLIESMDNNLQFVKRPAIRDEILTYATTIQKRIEEKDYRTKSTFADNLYRKIRELPCEEKIKILDFMKAYHY